MQEMPIIFKSFRRRPGTKSITPCGFATMGRLIANNARQGYSLALRLFASIQSHGGEQNGSI